MYTKWIYAVREPEVWRAAMFSKTVVRVKTWKRMREEEEGTGDRDGRSG